MSKRQSKIFKNGDSALVKVLSEKYPEMSKAEIQALSGSIIQWVAQGLMDDYLPALIKRDKNGSTRVKELAFSSTEAEGEES